MAHDPTTPSIQPTTPRKSGVAEFFKNIAAMWKVLGPIGAAWFALSQTGWYQDIGPEYLLIFAAAIVAMIIAFASSRLLTPQRGRVVRRFALISIPVLTSAASLFAWPVRQKRIAHEILARHFTWNEETKEAVPRKEEDCVWVLSHLDHETLRALQFFGTEALTLTCRGKLPDLAALKEITTLTTLRVEDCQGLASPAGLPSSVQTLYLGDCTGLISVEGLPAGMQTLFLSRCTGLTNAEGLPAGMKTLFIYAWPALKNLNGLPAGLRELSVGHYDGLTSVAGLPGSLTWLSLRNCNNLVEIEQLPAGLTSLSLASCPALERIGTLPVGLKEARMKNLPKLDGAVKERIRALVEKNGGRVVE